MRRDMQTIITVQICAGMYIIVCQAQCLVFLKPSKCSFCKAVVIVGSAVDIISRRG